MKTLQIHKYDFNSCPRIVNYDKLNRCIGLNTTCLWSNLKNLIIYFRYF